MEKLTNIIETILFVSGDAVAVRDISEKLEITDKQVLKAAEELKAKYEGDSGIHLLIFNDKLQFGSNKDYAEDVASVLNPIKERELSRSMLETAAIIAYKQPVTRVDLEEIRGNSEYAVQNLLKLGVIEVVGRKDAVGRPSLFGTTDKFLKRFQISSLDELPDYETLIQQIKELHGLTDDKYLFAKAEYDETKDPELIGGEEQKKPSEHHIHKKSEETDTSDEEKTANVSNTEVAATEDESASELENKESDSDDDDDDFVISSKVSHDDDEDEDEDGDGDELESGSDFDDEEFEDEEAETDDSDYGDDDEDDENEDEEEGNDDDDDDFDLKDIEDEELPDYLKDEDVEIITSRNKR